MKSKHRLAQCSSQQNFTIPLHFPSSPFHKVTTPHRSRINTSTPSVPASPITFLNSINKEKSPFNKQNELTLSNQSPITNRFNSRHDLMRQKAASPIPSMSKRPSSNLIYQAYHTQNTSKQSGCYQSFEQTLRSLAQKSPKSHLQDRTMQPKSKLSNNFKGILEAQQYQIQQRASESKRNPARQSKTTAISQYNQKLFGSCFQQEKRTGNQPVQRSSSNQVLLCMNDDGNKAKYMTIANYGEDEQLYYCLKCTALLVNQGFVLQQIQSIEQTENYQQDLEDICNKIELCKDKICSLINDLSMREEFQIIKITQFYSDLSNILEKCRIENEEKLKTQYKQKIQQYECILIEIDNFGKNLKETQQNITQFSSLQQQIVKFNLGQPFLTNYDSQLLKQMQLSFSQILTDKYTLIPQSKNNNKKRQQALQPNEAIINRNHGLRFSFQKLLSDISSKKSQMRNIINSLQEEDDEDSDQAQMQQQKNQKTAFRDLFPEAQQNSQINSSVNSPTFKAF